MSRNDSGRYRDESGENDAIIVSDPLVYISYGPSPSQDSSIHTLDPVSFLDSYSEIFRYSVAGIATQDDTPNTSVWDINDAGFSLNLDAQSHDLSELYWFQVGIPAVPNGQGLPIIPIVQMSDTFSAMDGIPAPTAEQFIIPPGKLHLGNYATSPTLERIFQMYGLNSDAKNTQKVKVVVSGQPAGSAFSTLISQCSSLFSQSGFGKACISSDQRTVIPGTVLLDRLYGDVSWQTMMLSEVFIPDLALFRGAVVSTISEIANSEGYTYPLSVTVMRD